MANELDKSIEELEAEVIAELEEGAHDAPTKGAMKSAPTGVPTSDPNMAGRSSRQSTG